MSTVWLNDLASANLLRKTYISGFLDISGGDMNVRSGNFFAGGTITQNTDSANVAVPSYSMFSVTDLSYMFASITQPMTTFAQDITTNGNTIVKQNLFVSNDASLNSRLFLRGDASMNSRLFLNGDASMNSRLFLNGDASMNSRLFLRGDASMNSRLSVGGDVSLNSRLSVGGDVSMNSKLSVRGDVSMNSNLQLASTSSIYGGTISGTTNDLNVYGLNVGAGDISSNSNLYVAGDVSFNSKLYVASEVSINGNLNVYNNTFAYGNLGIGKDTASSELDVSGSALVSGNIGIGKDTTSSELDVSGSALVSGNIGIGKTTTDAALDVSGSALVSGNIAIGGDVNYSRLTITTDTLSSVLGSTSNLATLYNSVGSDTIFLKTYNYRNSASSVWQQASTRIQYSVNTTNMAYIEFNPPGNSSDPGGIGIYTASTIGLTDVSGGITIKTNGNVAIGKTTADATLDISGSVLVSGNVAIGKTTAAVALDVSGYIKSTFVGFSITRITSNSAAISAQALFGINSATFFNNLLYNTGALATTGVFTAPVAGYYFFSFTNWMPGVANIITLRLNATTSTNGTQLASMSNVASGAAHSATMSVTVKLEVGQTITLYNGASTTSTLSISPSSIYTGYLINAI